MVFLFVEVLVICFIVVFGVVVGGMFRMVVVLLSLRCLRFGSVRLFMCCVRLLSVLVLVLL